MLTAERLRELLIYDPETGDFLRRIARRGHRVGTKAGSVHKTLGYVYVCVDGVDYLGHRLAWLYMTGEWPADEIDHERRDPGNNRWGNLRTATSSLNKANSKCRSDSTTGFKGVEENSGTFVAYIRIDKKRVRLGRFDTPEEAHAVYVAKAKEVFGEFHCAG